MKYLLHYLLNNNDLIDLDLIHKLEKTKLTENNFNYDI